jgi:uncharacterized tellurite resistance protein B-like protein
MNDHEAMVALLLLVAGADGQIDKVERGELERLLSKEAISVESARSAVAKIRATNDVEETLQQAVAALRATDMPIRVKACRWMWDAASASEGLDMNERGLMRRVRNMLGVSLKDMGVRE